MLVKSRLPIGLGIGASYAEFINAMIGQHSPIIKKVSTNKVARLEKSVAMNKRKLAAHPNTLTV